jgi:hypothetical protein
MNAYPQTQSPADQRFDDDSAVLFQDIRISHIASTLLDSNLLHFHNLRLHRAADCVVHGLIDRLAFSALRARAKAKLVLRIFRVEWLCTRKR